jgi:hypothetical protein
MARRWTRLPQPRRAGPRAELDLCHALARALAMYNHRTADLAAWNLCDTPIGTPSSGRRLPH